MLLEVFPISAVSRISAILLISVLFALGIIVLDVTITFEMSHQSMWLEEIRASSDGVGVKVVFVVRHSLDFTTQLSEFLFLVDIFHKCDDCSPGNINIGSIGLEDFRLFY